MAKTSASRIRVVLSKPAEPPVSRKSRRGTEPPMVRSAVGEVVPIPTLPDESTRIESAGAPFFTVSQLTPLLANVVSPMDVVMIWELPPAEVDLMPPNTSSFAAGLLVPIPTSPEASILMLSTPPSVKAMVSAAGKNIPVFVSPVLVMDGAVSEPSGNEATPVNTGESAVAAPISAGVMVVEARLVTCPKPSRLTS